MQEPTNEGHWRRFAARAWLLLPVVYGCFFATILLGGSGISYCADGCAFGFEVTRSPSIWVALAPPIIMVLILDVVMLRPIGTGLMLLGSVVTAATMLGSSSLLDYGNAALGMFLILGVGSFILCACWCIVVAGISFWRAPMASLVGAFGVLFAVLTLPSALTRLAIDWEARRLAPAFCLIQNGKLIDKTQTLSFNGIISGSTPRVRLQTSRAMFEWRFRRFQFELLAPTEIETKQLPICHQIGYYTPETTGREFETRTE